MQKKILILAIAALLLIIATIVVNDGWIYCAVALIAIVITVVIRSFSSTTIKITRWAKENPRKTQVLIGLLQLLIVAIALLIGYDLKELGYKLNDGPTIIFGIVLVSSFFLIRFFPKQNIIALPAVVSKDRMVYMAIVLSAFVILVITGNRIEDKFPNSPISLSLKAIDHSIFGDSFSNEEGSIAFESNPGKAILTNEKSSMLAIASTTGESIHNEILPKKEAREKMKAERKAKMWEKKKQKLIKRIEKLRKWFGGGATVLTVLLVILLIITSCAGICLIAIGGTAGAVILGIVLLGGSIFGFIKVFQRKQRLKLDK